MCCRVSSHAYTFSRIRVGSLRQEGGVLGRCVGAQEEIDRIEFILREAVVGGGSNVFS